LADCGSSLTERGEGEGEREREEEKEDEKEETMERGRDKAALSHAARGVCSRAWRRHLSVSTDPPSGGKWAGAARSLPAFTGGNQKIEVPDYMFKKLWSEP